MGIRYIGACCGFEPYHIRAIAEEVIPFLIDYRASLKLPYSFKWIMNMAICPGTLNVYIYIVMLLMTNKETRPPA